MSARAVARALLGSLARKRGSERRSSASAHDAHRPRVFARGVRVAALDRVFVRWGPSRVPDGGATGRTSARREQRSGLDTLFAGRFRSPRAGLDRRDAERHSARRAVLQAVAMTRASCCARGRSTAPRGDGRWRRPRRFAPARRPARRWLRPSMRTAAVASTDAPAQTVLATAEARLRDCGTSWPSISSVATSVDCGSASVPRRPPKRRRVTSPCHDARPAPPPAASADRRTPVRSRSKRDSRRRPRRRRSYAAASAVVDRGGPVVEPEEIRSPPCRRRRRSHRSPSRLRLGRRRRRLWTPPGSRRRSPPRTPREEARGR